MRSSRISGSVEATHPEYAGKLRRDAAAIVFGAAVQKKYLPANCTAYLEKWRAVAPVVTWDDLDALERAARIYAGAIWAGANPNTCQEHISEWLKSAPSPAPTADNEQEWLAKFKTLAEAQAEVDGIRAEVGRVLYERE